MGKSFSVQEPREPKTIEQKVATDPAYAAAASAFGPDPASLPIKDPVVLAPSPSPTPVQSVPAEPLNPAVFYRDRPAAPVRPSAPAAPRDKMTIYPGATERARLKYLKFQHEIAESIVAEYALEVLFATRTDDEIIATLRAKGHSLRRARTAQTA